MLEVRIKRVLRGFTLDVGFSIDGEVLSILGPSGSGKTMTLLCIAGLVCPDEGYVKLNDKVLLDSKRQVNVPANKRRIGFAFQNYALFPHLTARENISYGIRHWGADKSKKRVSELLELMSIPSLGDRYPNQLSAGQQQRVALARALAPEPEVLLLDEPLSALDSIIRERLQLEIKALPDFYKGNIVFVTHDLAEGYNIGSRIAVFESGRIVQNDRREIVVGCPSSRTVARLVGIKNLMKGSVTRMIESGALINIPELGGDVRVAIRKPTTLSEGQKVTIGIRPEHIQLADSPGENTFLATVDTLTQGIAATDYRFRVSTDKPGGHLVARMPSRPDLEILSQGQSTYLFLPQDRVLVIAD